MNPELAYLGTSGSTKTVQPVHFGKFETFLREGELLYFQHQGVELIRRIYVAVRDQNWGTVPNQVEHIHLHTQPHSFSTTFQVRNQADEIDFQWQGSISGESTEPHRGKLIFTMEGEALSDFYKNRIGICVLLPAHLAGTRVRCTKHPQFGGYIEKGRLPERISPHQPFLDFSSLEIDVAPSTTLSLTFEGDIFEMEDQRNWSDASFKIYSTPLRYPFPVLLRRGEKVKQKVTLTFETKAIPSSTVIHPPQQSPRIFVSLTPQKTLPALGFNYNEGIDRFHERAQRVLSRLKPSHLRIDLDARFSRRTNEEKVRQALDTVGKIGIPLWFSIAATTAKECEELLDLIPWQFTSRILISHGEPPWHTPSEYIARAKNAIKKRDYRCLLGGGTRGWFAEFNRQPPPFSELDLVFFAVSPQVHASDNETLVENLSTQSLLCQQAQEMSGLPVVLSPITFTVHFNPNATQREQRYTPPLPDPRQWGLWGMLWTIGSIKYALQAETLTFYELLGPRGILPSPEAQEYWSRQGVEEIEAFPVLHILKEMGERKAAQVLPTQSTHPLLVDALCLQEEAKIVLYVWNYSFSFQEITIEGGDFYPESIVTYDAENFPDLLRSLDFHPQKASYLGDRERINLVLKPCSLSQLLSNRGD